MILKINRNGLENHLTIEGETLGDDVLLKALELFNIDLEDKDKFRLMSQYGGRTIMLKIPIGEQCRNGDVLELDQVDRLTHKKGEEVPVK